MLTKKIFSSKNEFYVDDLTEDIVLNPEEVANLLKKGDGKMIMFCFFFFFFF